MGEKRWRQAAIDYSQLSKWQKMEEIKEMKARQFAE